ncbi:hypothetical protein PQ455_09025 [Sphingomonas naphthae]|uniref:Uncharacterized protein n=1 Tax=Sphingomonas naphthae TaxID=1813468 RepID=A0ABY7TRM5_9SPHN|nr:hypothetical protein [Sphingomonas naphthae]WCT75341.1 hypothetical protein PQ455_09025 [Sphingomonas naphthae]
MVSLAALIAVFETAPGGEGVLAASRAFAGASVLEHQARRARRAGAERLILLADTAHPDLLAIAQRLRRDGLPTDIATSITDAADRLHPDEPVLVIADGCLAAQAALAAIVAAPPPALLTVADIPGRDLFERIDASVRWAGVALLDGALLRETAEMVGEWDPLSVLLRRAVQRDATRIPIAEDGEDGLPVFAQAPHGLAGIERRLVSGTRGLGQDWPALKVYPLIEEALLPPLFRRQIDPWWLAAGSALLAGIGAVATHALPLAGLVALLLSGPTASLADRLALIRAGEIRGRRWFEVARGLFAVLALVALTIGLARGGQWGWWLLGLLVPAGMGALASARAILARLGERASPPWCASLDGLLWVALPFGIVGLWGGGLGAMAAYALGSFGWAQRRIIALAGR